MPDDLTDNAALNELVDLTGRIETSVRNGYDSIVGANGLVASLADPYVRTEMPTAVRTLVTNTGPEALRISEDGIIICDSLAVSDTWASVTAASGVLTIDTLGAGTTFSLATYLLNES